MPHMILERKVETQGRSLHHPFKKTEWIPIGDSINPNHSELVINIDKKTQVVIYKLNYQWAMVSINTIKKDGSIVKGRLRYINGAINHSPIRKNLRTV